MSNHKAYRARLNRSIRGLMLTSNMHVLANSDNAMRSIAPKDRAPHKMVSAYKDTLKHIRTNTKLGSRINIALGFEGDRMSRITKRIIEEYETYRLRNKYAKLDSVTLLEYIANRKDTTANIRAELAQWYIQHGNERISRMRKMHGIVGRYDKPWLRTE